MAVAQTYQDSSELDWGSAVGDLQTNAFNKNVGLPQKE